MCRLRVNLALFCATVLLIACVGCGASHMPAGQLQSITISPSTANGSAQFVATGFYSDGSKVTPLPALWFPVQPWYVPPMDPLNHGTLDETGKAACGVTGPFAVFAAAPVDPHFPLAQMTPTTPQVSGSAQLDCP